MTSAVDAGLLLKELDENWRSMGKSEEAGVLRACSMTLVVVIKESDDPQAMGETLAQIMHEHPNRTIVLRVSEDGAVEARTTIQCWMPFGRRQQVCCEQIEITAPRASLSAVPPILFGLMVADLPVALWCADAQLAALPELRPVLKLAGKVMVDTARLPGVGAAHTALTSLSGGTWRLADLTWARVTRWRETVAQLLKRGELPEWCELSYAGREVPASAAYLAGWLRQSLNLDVPLRCEDEETPPPNTGRIRSVRFGCKLRDVTLRRTSRTALSIIAGRMTHSAVFPLHTDAHLLHEELGVFGEDRQFEAALRRWPEVLGL
jgi:glucose-6-phosphate dehydrogenase assembly protein OpcA